MRYRGVVWAISICLLATCASGCESLERKKDDLKTKGVEFKGGKVVKVYKF